MIDTQHYLNYANPTNFFGQFTFEGKDTFKYYLQDSKLPDIQRGIIQTYYNGKLIYMEGDSEDQGSIELSFIVDEKLYIYTDFLEFRKKYDDILFEMFIQDNQEKTILKFVFENCFFSSIEGPQYSTKTDETEVYMNVTMNFENMYYKRY